MNYEKLIQEIKKSNYTMEFVADKIGVSRSGLSHMIHNRTLKVEALEKITGLLNISSGVFFNINDSFHEQFKKRQAHDKKVYGTAYSFITMIQNVSASFDLDNEDLKTVSSIIHDHFHEL